MRIHKMLRRLAVWLLFRLPYPVELTDLLGRPFTLIRGRVVPPLAGADGADDGDDDDKDGDDDKDADADKDADGDDADDDKDGDEGDDDDDEDKLPDNVKAILKKERDARRKAEREARRLKREARKPEKKPDPKKGDDKGDKDDHEDQDQGPDPATVKFRRANLRAALAEEGLSKELVRAAMKLIDVDDIEFDDDDEPTNLEDILDEARETYPFLKGEKPKRKSPNSNGGDGTGDEPKPALTAEELAAAKEAGMSADRYEAFKGVKTLEDYEKAEKALKAATK